MVVKMGDMHCSTGSLSEVATNYHDTLIIRWIALAEPKHKVSRSGGQAPLCKQKVT
jgi:hypothetical protein